LKRFSKVTFTFEHIRLTTFDPVYRLASYATGSFGCHRLRSFAVFLRRFPWIASLVTNIWRLGRPRFSVGALGVVVNEDNQILVVEHVFHPRMPWGLPGGWVDRSESLAGSVERELEEELSLRVTVEQTLIVEIAASYPNHIDVVYLCRPEGEIGKLSSELLDYRWSSLEALPPLPKLHYRAVRAALAQVTSAVQK
jgi:8-oxo-dGTP diphosphatase